MKSFHSGEVLQAHFDQLHATENDIAVVSCNFCQMSSRHHTKISKDWMVRSITSRFAQLPRTSPQGVGFTRICPLSHPTLFCLFVLNHYLPLEEKFSVVLINHKGT